MTKDGRPVQGAFGFRIHRLGRMSRDFRYRTLNRIRILLRIPQHPSGKVRRQIARIPHGLVVPQGGYASRKGNVDVYGDKAHGVMRREGMNRACRRLVQVQFDAREATRLFGGIVPEVPEIREGR